MSEILTTVGNATYTINDDEFQVLSDEFQQIRTCLGMYISKTGTEGALHLLKEIFNNALDESVDPNSLGKTIDVTFDEITQTFSVSDHSRGMPFDVMVDVTSKKHSGTKFNRVLDKSKMKEKCGRNGVGVTVTVALCDYFAMESCRLGERKLIEYIDGELVEHPVEKMKKDKHGLTVTFKPSSKYLQEEVNVTVDMVEDYFRKLSYVIPSDITIKLYMLSRDAVIKDPKVWEPNITRKYTRQGLAASVNYLSSTLEFSPVEIVNTTEDFDLEVAFSYDKTLDDIVIQSFCNYVNTTEGGYHETVAIRAICDFFVREAKKLDENSKYEVTFEDCKKGLIMAVNCKHFNPSYEGQHKSKVSNKDVLSDGKKGLTDALYKYFNNNNALLRRTINYLRQVARVRLETHKIKGVPVKKQTTFLDDAAIPGFYPISDRNYNGYTELIIGEGESAGGSIDNCRNQKYQAVFCSLGVDNVYGLTVEQMMSKKVFRNLVTILGCGVGKDFDINKLRYNKIIMESDADTDGNSISSRVFVFFVEFLPELILQGKVYKALPPLILLDNKVRKWYKGSLWLFSKEEYYNVANQIIADNVQLAIPGEDDNVVPLSKKDTIKWLEMNFDYNFELNRLEKRTICDKRVLEYICYYLYQSKHAAAFKELIEKQFNELTYDIADKSLYGSYDGKFISVIIDSLFMKMASTFMRLIEDCPSIFIYCKNRNDDNDRFDKMTIGSFLTSMDSLYNVKIEQRFKGLGEVDAEILFSTTLNPKLRRLVRFTIDDMEKTKKTFELLHAKNDKMRQERRDLLDNAKISYMDLDN